MTAKKWREVFKTLTIEGSEWVNEKAKIVNNLCMVLSLYMGLIFRLIYIQASLVFSKS